MWVPGACLGLGSEGEMGTRGVRGSRGAPALTLDARCLSLHGELCIPSCRGMGWSQTIPLYLRLWTPWSPVFSPPHHGEVQRGEGTCLQSHSMPTGDLVPNLLLFHPTPSRRNQHLHYPESITQPSKLEPWGSQFFAKWTGQKGKLTPLS